MLADTPVTPAGAEKIKGALEVIGCTDGKMEKETEGSGCFEVASSKDFKMIAMTRDKA